MEKIDVLYTVNDKYVDILLASMLSFIKRSNIPNIDFHIITSSFCLEDYNKIDEFIKKYSNTSVSFYPMESIDISRYNIPNWRGNQVANARLFFQDIMGSKVEEIDNLLYLDADAIVSSDLNDLEKYKAHLSLAKDCFNTSRVEAYGVRDYYNSGVIYINVQEWLNKGFQDKIIKLSKTSYHLMCPDQDVINLALKDDIKTLPQNYNLAAILYILDEFLSKIYFNSKHTCVSFEEATEGLDNPKIFHGYGVSDVRPWLNNNINPYSDIFMEYIEKINPDFEKRDLTGLRKLLAYSGPLYKYYIFLRMMTPYKINNKVKKLINICDKKFN